MDRARVAVIDGRDDNETLAIAVAVDHANPRVHMVAAVRDLRGTNAVGGRPAGDELLRRAADALRLVADERDRVFRAGGDELVLLARPTV